MINLQITIGDTDLHYLQKLSDYFMSVKTHHFSVKTFSDLSNLSNHLNTESTDILLITEKLYKQLHNIPPMTLLLRENGVGSNIKEHLSIPKYQSGSKIVEQMIHYYTLQSTSEVQFAPNRKKTALIGIYSPSGGSGKTTLSLMLAKALAAKGKNTLFISLEEIASYKHVLSATDETSLSDLLYYAHKRSDNLMMKLEGIQRLDKESGLKFIPAPIHSRSSLWIGAGIKLSPDYLYRRWIPSSLNIKFSE
ncbi:MAG: hypothetical protein H7X94_01910, partial [Vallitaleaceae bacterium]|nr:hypothetical protein [Vallitaleaceae bacterium]